MSTERGLYSDQAERINFLSQLRDTTEDLRLRLGKISAAALLMAGATIGVVVAEEIDPTPALADPSSSVTIGMPFDGKWAYNGLTAAACGPAFSQTSHPSCHEIYTGDWAVDLYAPARTGVKLKANGQNLSFAWENASGTCGETRRIKVSKDGMYIGRISFTHLTESASTSVAPTNDMTIGKVANLGCNPGGDDRHIHVEFENAGATYACYMNHSTATHTAGMRLGVGTSLGMLGSLNTAAKEECSVPPAAPPPPPPQAPSAVSWGNGRIDVYAKGAGDNKLWTNYYNGEWNWAKPLDQTVHSGPGVASWGPGRLDVFFRGPNGELRAQWYDGNSWHGSADLGGNIVGQPDAVSWSDGRIDVFVRGIDNKLYARSYERDGAGWGPWSGALFPAELTSSPTVASWAPGRLDVFARGTAGDLLHAWYSDGVWHSIESLGGQITGKPDAVSWGNGRIDVFAAGTDGKLWDSYYDGQWHWAKPLDQATTSAPAVASWGSGRLDVFFRGTNGELRCQWYDANGWHGSVDLGGAD